MVLLALNVTGDFENVLMLEPHGVVHNPDFGYPIKVKCSGCQVLGEKEHILSFNDAVPIPCRGKRPKGYIHFQRKCKMCGECGSITMISGRRFPLTDNIIGAGEKACLMVFSCSGLEPVKFNFNGCKWNILSLAGTMYKGVELVDGAFSKYDNGKRCIVSNLAATFDTA